MQITAILTPIKTTQTNTVSTATSEVTQNFASYLEDSTETTDNSLLSIFEKAAETYGVSVNLLTAMAKQESNFQTDATSKSGAMGIMQLMPATAKYLGCEDAYDPEQNIMAGAKYISELLDKYDGDTSLALAAYNAGSNNVAKYGGIPPFTETQNYVKKITQYMEEGVTLPDGYTVSASTQAASTDTSATSTYDLLKNLDSDSINTILQKILELAQKATGTASDTTAETETKGSLQVTITTSDDTAANSDAYYAYQNIHYNNSVMNLFTNNNSEA